ncbi:MAG: hypothetical protein HUJ72_07395 [Blautia sp.]|nr:hypothetical protein [Blautia sp.]
MYNRRNCFLAKVLAGCMALSMFVSPVYGEELIDVQEITVEEGDAEDFAFEGEIQETEEFPGNEGISIPEETEFVDESSNEAAEEPEEDVVPDEAAENEAEEGVADDAVADDAVAEIAEELDFVSEGFITEDAAEVVEAEPYAIKSVAITGLPLPLEGDKVADFSGKNFQDITGAAFKLDSDGAGDLGVKPGKVTYYKNGTAVTDETFVGGTTYQIEVQLTSADTSVYVFPDECTFSASMNGSTSVKLVRVSDDCCKLKYDYTVPISVRQIEISGIDKLLNGNKPDKDFEFTLNGQSINATTTMVCNKAVIVNGVKVLKVKGAEEVFAADEEILYVIEITLSSGYRFTDSVSINSGYTVKSVKEDNRKVTIWSDSSQVILKNDLCLDQDGKLRFYVNGVFSDYYTGLYSGPKEKPGMYYVIDGIVDETFTSYVKVGKTWCAVVNGQFKGKLTGLFKDDKGIWQYAKDGVFDPTYTGLASRIDDSELYYVSNGLWDVEANLLVKYQDKWHKVEAGEDKGYWSGIVKDGDTNIYVKDGVIDTSYKGLAKKYNDSKLYYVTKGTLNSTYLGFVSYKSKWYYVFQGVSKGKVTGFYKDGKKWKTAKKGVFVEYTGLAKRPDTGKFFYAKNGIFKSVTKAVKHTNNKWYYVKKGERKGLLNGFFKEDGKWKVAQKGVFDPTYTGLAYKPGEELKLYYAKDGYFKKYNGYASFKGKTYKVVDGAAVM